MPSTRARTRSAGVGRTPSPSTRKGVDGLLYTSSMTGADAAALFLPAADSFPRGPELSLPLSDPGLVEVVEGAAERIGYVVT